MTLRVFALLLTLLLSLVTLASCSASGDEVGPGDIGVQGGVPNRDPNAIVVGTQGAPSPDEAPSEEGEVDDEAIDRPTNEDVEIVFKENDFVKTSDEAISTFSSDVDTASYAYFRKLVTQGHSFDSIRKAFGKQLRTEEMLNYFKYRYTAPTGDDVFGVHSEIAPCPWNPESALLMLNLTAKEAERNESGNNLVFLIDVSGSMYSSDKLPLLKEAFSCLVEKLTDKDRVSIVTYSGAERVVLEATKGSEKEVILDAINSLEASGSTNGQAGIRMAYQIAESCYIEGGNNRIIMASDGDLNVGISSAEELKNYIATKRDAGIYLSVLGFGTGNYQDAKMEALADNGNGVYYYIDGIGEAERIFGEGLTSTLYTVAKDVKLQITFDPAYVDSYRLIGYENRILATEDFTDDTKDAGEVGSGHTVTVCYELKLTEDALRDNTSAIVPLSTGDGAWFTLAVRWKEPDATESIERTYTVGASSYTETPSYDFRFAAAVIETAMLLHDSAYIGDITLDDVIAALSEMSFTDEKKNEFTELLRRSWGA